MSESHEHQVIPAKTYFNVLLTLLVLTILTVVAAQFDFGAANTIIALFIATIKAAFVFAVFMNLRNDSKLHWMCLGSAVFFLLLLYGLAAIDIITRVEHVNTL